MIKTKEQASFTELLEHQESIILDLESLHYYSLNAAATLLWKNLRSGAAVTVEELGALLEAAFGLDQNRAEADADEFIGVLEQYRLISFTGGELDRQVAITLPPVGTLADYDPPTLKTSSTLMELRLATGSATASSSSVGGPP